MLLSAATGRPLGLYCIIIPIIIIQMPVQHITTYKNIYWNDFAILVAHHNSHFDILVGDFAASATSQFTLHQRNVDVISHVT